MKNDESYYDRVALSLYRKYSKNELIRYYKNRLSGAQLEHGKDKAYIDELEHENSRLKAAIQSLEGENSEAKKEIIKEIKSDALYKQLLGHNRKLTEQNKRLEKSYNELIQKTVQKDAEKKEQ